MRRLAFVVLVLLCLPATASAALTPRCADPGATVTLTGQRLSNNATSTELFATPSIYDPKAAQPDVADQSETVDLGTFPLTPAPSPDPQFPESQLNAQFPLPAALTTSTGAKIEGWTIRSEGRGADGTKYGPDDFAGFVDSTNRIAETVDKVSKGNTIRYRAGSFGTSKLYARLRKGGKTKTFALPKSMQPADNDLSCGFAFGSIPTSKLKKGTYTVTIGTSKSGAGVDAGKVKLT